MSPSYRDGDYLLTRRYGRRQPRAGDDVVMTHPDFGPILKRVASVVDGQLRLRGLNLLSADSSALGVVDATNCPDLRRVAFRIPRR